MLLLLACHAPADAPASPEEALAPQWSASEAEGEVDRFFSLDPLALGEARDTWVALLDQGDADCPGDPRQLPGTDLRGCTADSGVFYAGMATFTEDALGGFVLSGDFEILDVEGHRFFGGGSASRRFGGADWGLALKGDWGWTGGGGWMDPEVSAWIEAGGDGQFTQVDGGLTEGGLSAWFEALRADSSCAGVSGALELRDPVGGWWRLDYGECGSCAALSFEGEDRGEACPAAAAWLASVAENGR